MIRRRAGGPVVLALTGALTGNSDDERVADVVRDVRPATVRIESRSRGARGGLGSGWVLDRRDGLVVTAAHVINSGQRFLVRFGAVESQAEAIGVAPCEDLAVLRVTELDVGHALALDDGGAARQGETEIAFGYPETADGEPAASTRGVVSARAAQLRDPASDVPAYPSVIRTDTALDPGFSGGPLVDLDGRLVGVNAAARTTGPDGRALQGANYAISAGRAKAVLDVLRYGESLGWIGASLGYPSKVDLATRGLPPGLWIQGVLPGSPADRAGLRDGDYAVAVDGRPQDGTLAGWCRAAGEIRSGQSVELRLAPPGESPRTVRVRLD